VRLQPQVRTLPGARLRPSPLPLAASTQTKPWHSRPLTPISGRLPGCQTTVSSLSPVSMHSSRCQAGSCSCTRACRVDLLAAALELQRAVLAAGLAVEAVVTFDIFEPRQRYLDTSLIRQ
jgi:hypothetical protein